MENTKRKEAMTYLQSVRQITKHRFGVDSQGDDKRSYTVQRVPHTNTWYCDCRYFHWAITRTKNIHCYHIMACIIHREKKYKDSGIERLDVEHICPECHCTVLNKNGVRSLKDGIKRQMYRCSQCNHRFTLKVAGFMRLTTKPEIISEALDLHMDGVSYRNLARHIKSAHKKDVTAPTIMKWFHRYSDILREHLDKRMPELSDVLSIDEAALNIKGTEKTEKGFYAWLWSIIDPHTKYLVATMISEAGDQGRQERHSQRKKDDEKGSKIHAV